MAEKEVLEVQARLLDKREENSALLKQVEDKQHHIQMAITEKESYLKFATAQAEAIAKERCGEYTSG